MTPQAFMQLTRNVIDKFDYKPSDLCSEELSQELSKVFPNADAALLRTADTVVLEVGTRPTARLL